MMKLMRWAQKPINTSQNKVGFQAHLEAKILMGRLAFCLKKNIYGIYIYVNGVCYQQKRFFSKNKNE